MFGFLQSILNDGILEGENGLILAVTGSSDLLWTGNAIGRSAVFGVRKVNPPIFDKIDLRISLLCVFAGVAVPLSNDDFLIRVFGVAGVSNNLNARTFRYGGDSKCNFDCIIVVCRNGRVIGFPWNGEKHIIKFVL